MPSGLTELLTPGEAKYRRRGDAVDKYLAAANRVAETKPGAGPDTALSRPVDHIDAKEVR